MGDVVSGKDIDSSEKSWQLAGGSWQSVNIKYLRKSARKRRRTQGEGRMEARRPMTDDPCLTECVSRQAGMTEDGRPKGRVGEGGSGSHLRFSYGGQRKGRKKDEKMVISLFRYFVISLFRRNDMDVN